MATSSTASTEPTEPTDLTFPDDFDACEERRFFEHNAVDLAFILVGQYLYCHSSSILVQIVEAEAFSEADVTIYQAMFGSPCAQFRVKAGQVVARFPQLPQPTTITPQNVVADMEIYITAGRDEQCGDVVRLISFMPVEGLEELGERLGYNDVENMLIGSTEIVKALGACGGVLNWDANPFLFQSGGVQLYFLKKKLRKLRNVVKGPRFLDTTRVGVNPSGHDADASFSLDFDSDMHQRY